GRKIALRRGRGRRWERRGRALIAAGKGLVAQRELQRAIAGREPGGLQGAFERGRIAPQQGEGIGAIDHEVRGGPAAAVDVERYLDAAEVRWVEPDLETLLAGFHPRSDRDRDAGERDRIEGDGRVLRRRRAGRHLYGREDGGIEARLNRAGLVVGVP